MRGTFGKRRYGGAARGEGSGKMMGHRGRKCGCGDEGNALTHPRNITTVPEAPRLDRGSTPDLHDRRPYPCLDFDLAHHLTFVRVANRGAPKHSALIFHVYLDVASRVDLDPVRDGHSTSTSTSNSTSAPSPTPRPGGGARGPEYHALALVAEQIKHHPRSPRRTTSSASRLRTQLRCCFPDSHAADASPERDLLDARYSSSPTADMPILTPSSFLHLKCR
ncbi:hypothetical protein C8R45DRAFT_1214775 [Mycena sanguinolenta]|nr:hypothetical protein C8R45DRAFT_1214775 [Mycena sanguinolenta]